MTLRTARNYLHTGLVLELLKPRETKYKPIRGNDTYGLILCLTRCKAQKITRVKRASEPIDRAWSISRFVSRHWAVVGQY